MRLDATRSSTTIILIGRDLNATCHWLISCYSRAVPDKVGGNYWRHAWLSSQGHFFCCCSDWSKRQGFSLPYDFRTPQHFLSLLNVFHFISAARILQTFAWMPQACVCARRHACKEKKSLSLVRHLILLLIIGEHDSSFSPFPKWATSSTVLPVITNLVGTCKARGQRRGRMKSRVAVNKTEARGRAGKEGRKRAAAQTVTKQERKGEEIWEDRLQEKDVGGGLRQDQGEVTDRKGLNELHRATCNSDKGLAIWNSRLHKSFHVQQRWQFA